MSVISESNFIISISIENKCDTFPRNDVFPTKVPQVVDVTVVYKTKTPNHVLPAIFYSKRFPQNALLVQIWISIHVLHMSKMQLFQLKCQDNAIPSVSFQSLVMNTCFNLLSVVSCKMKLHRLIKHYGWLSTSIGHSLSCRLKQY